MDKLSWVVTGITSLLAAIIFVLAGLRSEPRLCQNARERNQDRVHEAVGDQRGSRDLLTVKHFSAERHQV